MNAETGRGTPDRDLYGTVLATLAEGVLVLGADGRIVECNAAAERILGYPAQFLIGRDLVSGPRHAIGEDGTPFPWTDFPAITTLSTGDPCRNVVVGLRQLDGTIVWLSINSSPIPSADGSGFAVLCSFVDITDSKRAEHLLRRRLREQETLHQLSTAVIAARSLEEVFGLALEGVQAAAEADRAAILLFDGDGVMRFRAWRGLSPEYRAAAEGHSPWVPTDGPVAPITIPEVARDDSLGPLRDRVLAEGIQSLGFVPLTAGRRLIGKFMIYYDRPHGFDEGELHFLETLSAQLGIVVERRQREDALQRSEEQFRQLVEVATDIIYRTDIQGRFRYVSPTAASALEYQPHELLGTECLDLVRADVRAEVGAFYRDQRARGVPSTYYELPLVTRSGRVIWVGQHLRLLTEGGVPIATQAIARDITERRNLEERLRQSQKMEAVGQLAGGVAHDFNNLLTVIVGNASLLLTEPELAPVARANVAEIATAADRAATLVRQLLTFSRRQIASARPVDLAESIAGMVSLLRRLVGERTVLETRFADRIPLVRADAGMMEQVVMNLVLNARDAMPGGGRITLALDAEVGTLGRAPGPAPVGGFVRLTVTDTGTGIAPDDLPHIFEPFFTTKEVGRGTGLGLATVFGIVEQHGGWIEVDSEPNRGSTFRVLLPAADPPAASAPGSGADSAGSGLPSGVERSIR